MQIREYTDAEYWNAIGEIEGLLLLRITKANAYAKRKKSDVVNKLMESSKKCMLTNRPHRAWGYLMLAKRAVGYI